eukprot:177021-Hanusia_phi.AAC.1
MGVHGTLAEERLAAVPASSELHVSAAAAQVGPPSHPSGLEACTEWEREPQPWWAAEAELGHMPAPVVAGARATVSDPTPPL